MVTGPEWCGKSVLILGCGNILLEDDGFGICNARFKDKNIACSIDAMFQGTFFGSMDKILPDLLFVFGFSGYLRHLMEIAPHRFREKTCYCLHIINLSHCIVQPAEAVFSVRGCGKSPDPVIIGFDAAFKFLLPRDLHSLRVVYSSLIHIKCISAFLNLFSDAFRLLHSFRLRFCDRTRHVLLRLRSRMTRRLSLCSFH